MNVMSSECDFHPQASPDGVFLSAISEYSYTIVGSLQIVAVPQGGTFDNFVMLGMAARSLIQ
jgi:hypothetical protein